MAITIEQECIFRRGCKYDEDTEYSVYSHQVVPARQAGSLERERYTRTYRAPAPLTGRRLLVLSPPSPLAAASSSLFGPEVARVHEIAALG